MMERLTDRVRNFDGTASSPKSLVKEEGMQKGMPSAYCSAIVTKLADYEDAEEQGLLLRLPCKVGDNIFVLVDMDDNGKYTSIKNDIVECIYLNDTLDLIINFTWIWHDISTTEIGKTVFLTREEAEQALETIESDIDHNR